MYSHNDYYGNRFRRRKKKKHPSLISYFITGLIGALIGGLILTWNPFGDKLSGLRTGDSGYESTSDVGNAAVISAVEKVAPAVVGISNSVSIVRRGSPVLVEQASGSGVVINRDGYIATNQHVIDEADRIDVVFRDGTIVKATLVGEDVLTDLAVVKIEKEGGIIHAELSDSELVRPGEVAIAIGNPLGLIFQHSVTAGVVSAVKRQVPIPGSQYRYTFIQTDAAINEGNSGGPLVNLAGEIIGINSAKIKDAWVEGIGFAIPSNTVERVVEDIIRYGKVRRPFIGIYIQDLAEVTGASMDRGVYIKEISPGGPGEEAGLRDGDIILNIDGHEINFTAQLFDRLLNYQPGDEISIRARRDNQYINKVIKLGEMPD